MSAKNKAFFLYWSIAIFVVVFFMFKSPVKPRDQKNIIFSVISVASIAFFPCWRVYPKIIWTFFLLGVMGFVNQHHFFATTPMINLLGMLVGAGVLSQFCSNWSESSDDWAVRFISAIGMTQCLWIAFNYWNIDPYQVISGNEQVLSDTYKNPEIFPVIGSLGHWMVTASFLMVCSPYMIKLHWLMAIPIGVSSWMLPSDVPVITIPTMVFAWLCLKYKKDWLIPTTALFGVLLVPLLSVKYGVLFASERFKIWEKSLEFNANPVFGMGLGYFRDAFKFVYAGQFIENHRHPHNEVVSIYVAFGVIGLAVLGYWGYFIWKNRRLDATAFVSLVGFACVAMVGFPLHISSVAIIGIISLASIINKSDNINTGVCS